MRLLLVRHGQSLANIEARIQGDDDPLTDAGRAQAEAAGAYLRQRHAITHLYASPLARAKETAEIIGRHVGIAPVFERGLAEINAGTAVGLLWDEWTERYPEAASRLRSEQRTLADRWEGGESGQEFIDRVFTAYDHIVTQHRTTDDVVAVVSHGGPLSWISARVHGDPLEQWPVARSIFGNCSISELEIDAEGAHTIGAWNQTTHIDTLIEQ
jgi:broad specificity phosphatase PhoE